ncbi:salicylate hydroxylase [Zafaria cholistanensis]|uniref:Salicylate hydroxylase n=1 Tax=Zafaria cholistanensis TaxID=1682741 RepID=A0A5A7NU17_9MICC|nr:FAD-dependent monooxygenase [Zafaria cholistanensis]GER23308.1 salicylate hydroxylase [Zafaria cholistanensis]
MDTSTIPSPPLHVAVVGGGIGGLAAAAFLGRSGHRVTVFEQAPALGEVGAGLVVAPNAVRLLRRLGVMDQLQTRAVRLEAGWEFRRWSDGTVLSVEDLASRCAELYGEDTYVLHRADLLSAIRSAVPDEALRLGSHVDSVEQDADGVRLTLGDGTTHHADVLLGADGVHSLVRGIVAAPTPAEYSGMCAFRALVPADKAPDFARRPAQTLWIGPDHHLVHYPISGGEYVNVVAFAPAGEFTRESWSATAELEELLVEFKGWDPRLEELIKAADRPGRWALLDRKPLDRWTHGRITLLGDAAHPMFPFFAQGAAQAIEDAAVFAGCLTKHADEPELALKTYESLRIERTTRLQEMSHARKDINHLPDGPEQQARDAQLADGDALTKASWIYSYDPARELDGAVL